MYIVHVHVEVITLLYKCVSCVCRSERGSPSPSETSDADIQSQKCHSDIVSNGHISHRGGKGRRYNRPNQLTVVNPYEV